MPRVTYRIVPNFPAYRVGSDGSVWSRWEQHQRKFVLGKRWRHMKLTRLPCGHLMVSLCPGRRKVLVHRLILEVFVGPCPEGMECRHFPDRDPSNNRLENLSWGTRQSNRDDMIVHGTTNRTLSDEEVRNIRAAYAERLSRETGSAILDDLAGRFGKSKSCIMQIVYRRNYKAVL